MKLKNNQNENKANDDEKQDNPNEITFDSIVAKRPRFNDTISFSDLSFANGLNTPKTLSKNNLIQISKYQIKCSFDLTNN